MFVYSLSIRTSDAELSRVIPLDPAQIVDEREASRECRENRGR